MRGKEFREASAHVCGFSVGHLPVSRLRLSRHFLVARPPLLRDAGGALCYRHTHFAMLDS